MIYGIMADSVVIIHFLWILFLIFGGVWGTRKRLVKYIHIPGVVFACVVELCDWYCPLTHLEVWLRGQYPGHSYSGSFITHYLERLIYIDLPRWAIIVLTIMLFGMNFLLYLRRWDNQRMV